MEEKEGEGEGEQDDLEEVGEKKKLRGERKEGGGDGCV